MKKIIVIFGLITLNTVCLTSCETKKKTVDSTVTMALPPTIVYKTIKNYDKNVAVQLSEDKQRITAYPHPYDVSADSYPTTLKNGYLLDNRGIGKNTAFISLTYEEYAALRKPPSIKELDSMIIDRNPIDEMYNCGNRAKYADIINELNRIIEKNFEGCNKIK